MGWLKNLIDSVKGKGATDYLFIPALNSPSAPAVPIVPDECYIELVVESLRIDKERAFATKFHGVVYTFTSLARIGDNTASFAAVTKPEKLAELDKESVGKVLVLSKRMMGPVPWRGGRLEVQLGLFSIKSGNLLTPVLNFVTKVSEAAGIGIGAVVKPFVPLIAEGMDMIAGQTEDTKLVVGIDSGFELGQTMRCAIIATSKTALDAKKITLDPADGKLLLAGQPLEAAYCVFSIVATDQKADFGEIPELKSAYALFRDCVVKGEEDEARKAFAAFRRLALASPDLITNDAARLVAKANALLSAAFGEDEPGSGGVAISARGGRPVAVAMPEELGAIALYAD
jgi:hypothetical protein